MNRFYENIRFLKDCIEFEVFNFFTADKRVKKLKNIHKGERCFIIGTGPSLQLADVERLKDEYTFTVNSAFKIFDKTSWRPTYYVVADPKFWEDMGDELIKYSDEISHPICNRDIPWKREDIVYLNYNKKYHNKPKKGLIHNIIIWSKENFMSDNIRKGVIAGHTVMFAVLQIAKYMGFEEIYLLGVDCDYSGSTQYSELTPHRFQNSQNAGELMLLDYWYCRRHFEKKKIKVFNASRGGKLEVFRRADLDKVIYKK